MRMGPWPRRRSTGLPQPLRPWLLRTRQVQATYCSNWSTRGAVQQLFPALATLPHQLLAPAAQPTRRLLASLRLEVWGMGARHRTLPLAHPAARFSLGAISVVPCLRRRRPLAHLSSSRGQSLPPAKSRHRPSRTTSSMSACWSASAPGVRATGPRLTAFVTCLPRSTASSSTTPRRRGSSPQQTERPRGVAGGPTCPRVGARLQQQRLPAQAAPHTPQPLPRMSAPWPAPLPPDWTLGPTGKATPQPPPVPLPLTPERGTGIGLPGRSGHDPRRKAVQWRRGVQLCRSCPASAQRPPSRGGASRCHCLRHSSRRHVASQHHGVASRTRRLH